MKTILLAVCLTLLSAEAQAISRYTSTSMSCARIQGAIQSEGAVVLRWTSPTSGVPRYDRYVRDNSYCSVEQRARSTSVPAADTKSCKVYNCQPRVELER